MKPKLGTTLRVVTVGLLTSALLWGCGKKQEPDPNRLIKLEEVDKRTPEDSSDGGSSTEIQKQTEKAVIRARVVLLMPLELKFKLCFQGPRERSPVQW